MDRLRDDSAFADARLHRPDGPAPIRRPGARTGRRVHRARGRADPPPLSGPVWTAARRLRLRDRPRDDRHGNEARGADVPARSGRESPGSSTGGSVVFSTTRSSGRGEPGACPFRTGGRSGSGRNTERGVCQTRAAWRAFRNRFSSSRRRRSLGFSYRPCDAFPCGVRYARTTCGSGGRPLESTRRNGPVASPQTNLLCDTSGPHASGGEWPRPAR